MDVAFKAYLRHPRGFDALVLDVSPRGACARAVAAGGLPVDSVLPAPGAFKLQGVHAALAPGGICPDVLAAYDRVALLDDDVDMVGGAGALLRAFLYADAAGVDIAQPSLSPGSRAALPCTRHVPGGNHTVRVGVGHVEVMMPIFTARALARWLPEMAGAASGWGLGAYWAAVTAAEGGAVGVIDAVQATHTKPVSGRNTVYARLGGLDAAKREREGWAARLGVAPDALVARARVMGTPVAVSIARLEAEPWAAGLLAAE